MIFHFYSRFLFPHFCRNRFFFHSNRSSFFLIPTQSVLLPYSHRSRCSSPFSSNPAKPFWRSAS